MDENEDSIDLEFELIDTSEPNTLVLVCVSNRPPDPAEYAQALISYAEDILHKATFATLDRETMN